MSYCRFSDADAYIYDDIRYGIICCVCSLMPVTIVKNRFSNEEFFMNENFVAEYDYDLMLSHIQEHRAAGDYIPEDVDESLILERDCNHEFNNEGICKHCWRRKGLNV